MLSEIELKKKMADTAYEKMMSGFVACDDKNEVFIEEEGGGACGGGACGGRGASGGRPAKRQKKNDDRIVEHYDNWAVIRMYTERSGGRPALMIRLLNRDTTDVTEMTFKNFMQVYKPIPQDLKTHVAINLEVTVQVRTTCPTLSIDSQMIVNALIALADGH